MTWVVPLSLGGLAIAVMALFTMLGARKAQRAQAAAPAAAPHILIHDINDDRCTGCDACVAVCPTNVLDLVDNKSRVLRFHDCIQCEACMWACPTVALVMFPEGSEPQPLKVPELDDSYQTGVPGQYLIGEVAGKPLVQERRQPRPRRRRAHARHRPAPRRVRPRHRAAPGRRRDRRQRPRRPVGGAVVHPARAHLRHTVAGWKVCFLGSAETIGAVAEILSHYPDVPLVSYLRNLGWLDDDTVQPYLEAFKELILPATEVLVGSHKTLTDFLLPDWDSERPPSARELAVAAGERGTRYVLVTGIHLSSKGAEQFIDNVLASPQGALTGEKFEMFDTSFVGAGDTLSAALAALLASGGELHAAVGEALAFMDQSLDAGLN